MSFYLYQHSNLQALADKYIRLRRSGVYFGAGQGRRFLPVDPLQAETIVVATYGMRIWLTQYAACQGAVVANVDFLYVNNFISDELRRQLQGRTEFRPELFSNEVMTWRILELMEQGDPSCQALQPYLQLEDSQPELRRYELATRIAGVFDQYQVYLPELLEQWQTTLPEDPQVRWQAEIWQKLQSLAGEPVLSSAAALHDFLSCAADQLLPRESVAVFGIGNMPPTYFRVLRQLANATDVHFFYHNPCSEYWADHPIPRQRRKGFRVEDPAEMNPLLGAFGLQGQDFFKEIMELEGSYEEPEQEEKRAERSVFPNTLLGQLQADIVQMRTFPPGSEKKKISSDQHSLSFHNCHTRFRQVEVLHDQLLRLFQQNQQSAQKKLYPDDILVMAPDLAGFVPAIEAVFSQGPLKNYYALSDRSLRKSNRLAEAFLSILEFGSSRFECSRVLSLLDADALRKRFKLDDWAVKKLQDWVRQAYVCWGIDAGDREQVCGIPFDAFSWRHAINRLMLGIALENPTESQDDWNPGGLALPDLPPLNLANSAEERELLGNFSEFLEKLIRSSATLQQARRMPEWQSDLEALLDDFFQADNDTAADYAVLRQTIRSVAAAASAADFNGPVSFSVIQRLLSEVSEVPVRTYPFLSGKITFCSLQPMRSVPRRVIVLLGLDDGVFPRVDSLLGFNLIPQAGLRCRRSRQWEDRYLFLEALLAAEEQLLIFYRGQDDQRQKEYPPALPVTELRDYISDHYSTEQASDLLPRLTFRHRLHPYAPECYGKPEDLAAGGLFSYNPNYFPVAQKLAAGDLPHLADFAAGMPESGFPLPQSRKNPLLRLEQLIRFFQNSSETFLIQTLGFPNREWLQRKQSDLEPIELAEPEKIALSKYLAQLQKQASLNAPERISLRESLLRWLQAENVLPAGEPGRQIFQELLERSWFSDVELRRAWGEQQRVYRRLELPFQNETLILEGTLQMNPEAHTIVECRFKKGADRDELKDRDKIAAYLRYLMALATAAEDIPVRLFLYTSVWDKKPFTLPGDKVAISSQEAKKKLLLLADAYFSGLQKPLSLLVDKPLAPLQGDLANPDKIKLDNSLEDAAFARLFTPETFASDEFKQSVAEITRKLFGELA